ncbi:MAG: hypothetical protein KJP13_05365 [Altererythrobacter sp.]|nr:hypothetical protein [Altererythrobacter sp.]
MSDTTSRRVRRGRDEWQHLIDEQAGSGQTQAAFCEAQGLSLASFGNWKRRLTTAESTEQPWFELSGLSDVGSSSAGWDIELQLGDGICLRLRRC